MVGQTQFVLSLYTYIDNGYTFKAPIEEFANIAGEEISERAKKDIMTIAEQMMHRGLEKGEIKGKLEVANNMILAGSDPAFIIKVTGLSLQKIKELQKKTMK